MLNFVKNRFRFFITSVVLIVISVIALAAFGLQLGVEFQSGSTMTLHFEQDVEQDILRSELAALGHSAAIIQRTGDGDYFIHTTELTSEQKDDIVTSIATNLGTEIQVLDFSSVSPIIASEIWRNVAIAIGLSAVGMLLYIAWAFRKMPNPFRWSVCAIVALLHDLLITIGVFAILGKVSHVEIDSMFIIAILTILGYSINNTIVVFDRIRENMGKAIHVPFETVVNDSIIGTLGRQLNTSLTTIFVVVALLVFGGTTIHNFVLVLLVGFISGLYSSLFISGPLLVTWETGSLRGTSENTPGLQTSP